TKKKKTKTKTTKTKTKTKTKKKKTKTKTKTKKKNTRGGSQWSRSLRTLNNDEKNTCHGEMLRNKWRRRRQQDLFRDINPIA
ncbi:hypothetical protein BHM03_00041794, partial [Ensete ventricosum]